MPAFDNIPTFVKDENEESDFSSLPTVSKASVLSSHSLDDITGLAIYDDRVEISNPGHFPPGVTPENIKTFHASRPHNPKLAQVLYKATRIENWGSGIQRMISTCLKQELPEPFYQIWVDGTIVIVFRKKKTTGNQNDVPQGGTQGGTQAALKEKIIQIIRLDDKTTIQKISEMTGVSVRTLKRRINEIPNLRYVGSGYSGHWEIVGETAPKEDTKGTTQ